MLLNCEIHGLLIRVLGPSAGLINPSGEHVFDLLLVSHIYLQKHYTHNYNIYKTLFLSCKMYSLLVRCSDSKAQPIWQHHENAFNLRKYSSPLYISRDIPKIMIPECFHLHFLIVILYIRLFP